jgi:hypothetical protein
MTPDSKKRLGRVAACAAALVVVLSICGWMYVRANPLVFNESFFEHRYCLKQTASELLVAAHDNAGRFPSHTNGYADAIMSLNSVALITFSGPGYPIDPLRSPWNEKNEKRDVPEQEIGRVYVQGLRAGDNPQIAILFDKLPTPGDDHCHGLRRLSAKLGREVGFVDGSITFIPEQEWAEFSRRQIELLIAAEVPKSVAESYYTEQAKPELAALAKKYSNR